MKQVTACLAAVMTFLSLISVGQAAGMPQDIQIVNARISGNFVVADIKNVSDHPVDSFNAYFYIFTRDGQYTETVEAPFIGTLRPGYKATIKGGIYKSYHPGPGIVNFHEIKFVF